MTTVTTVVTDQNQSRTVKPRSRTYPYLPIVAISGEEVLTEQDGTMTLIDLRSALPSIPPTLFVTVGAADLVAWFNQFYLIHDPEHWQWRASDHEQAFFRPGAVAAGKRVTTIIHYFGFRRENKERSLYHRIIDPITMYSRGLSDVWPSTDMGEDGRIDHLKRCARLMGWAKAVRGFCQESEIQVRPTIGSIGVQFLTDKRFYPDSRRKVPAKINERVREQLPGNHYHLSVTPSPKHEWNVYYIDQHRAHHYHAARIAFPDANHLYAHGRFKTLGPPHRDYVSGDFMGLYCLDLQAPLRGTGLSWLGRGKLEAQFVYSNELPHLLDTGYKVIGVRAAWGSPVREQGGLNTYATWACEQLDKYGNAPWLKPILLATYGTLACKPKYQEGVFRLSKTGEPVILLTGRHRLNGRRSQSKRKLEPGIANVLHRGMIEAATRSESVGLAQQLEFMGQRIISIYADAVVVEINEDRPLPVLPEPWEVKGELTHYRVINQQAFMSDQMTKLPGVGKEAMSYRPQSVGHAPRVEQYNVLTGEVTKTDRRIYGKPSRPTLAVTPSRPTPGLGHLRSGARGSKSARAQNPSPR